MKKIIALSLVIALSFLVLAPLPAFAGGRHGVSGGAAAAIGLGALAIGVWAGHVFSQPQIVVTQPYPHPVYVPQPQPVYVPPMYRSPVCVGQLEAEYGWRPHWTGNGMEYVQTGRYFCRGQIIYR